MRLSTDAQLKFSNIAYYIVLLTLTLYTYRIFFSSHPIGGYDALWYERLITDALIQSRHHFFPSYIGQSDFNYFGVTLTRAPLLILLSQALDFVTLHKFPALGILHATAIINAIFGSFISYYLLRKILIHSRLTALTLSFLYVSAPGVIVLLYVFDMYFSFSALPFVPMVIYCLATFPKNNWWGIFGLALSWMAHPPIAIVLTGISLIYLTFHALQDRRNIGHVAQIFIWVFALSAWQFISIFQMHTNSLPSESPYPVTHESTVQLLLNDIPAHFYPFSHWVVNVPITFCFQMGYSLWLMLAMSILFYYKNRKHIPGKLWLVTLLLLIMLYPLSILKYLWYLIPTHLLSIFEWPMQRFYIVLSSLTCFIAAFTLHRLSINKILLAVISLTCILWNMHQSNFMHRYLKIRTANFGISQPTLSKMFYTFSIEPIHRKYSRGYYEPALKNKLFNSDMKIISDYDLEEALKKACLQHPVEIIKHYTMYPPMPYPQWFNMSQRLVRIKIPNDQKQVLCFHTQSRHAQVYFDTIVEKEILRTVMMAIPELGPTGLMFLPNHSANHPTFDLFMESWGDELKVDLIGHTTYDLNQLPIKTIEDFPLKIQLNNPEANTFLEIFKIYYPGYKALVNGQIVEAQSSKNKLVLIPLKSSGPTTIELTYRGTTLMHWSFYITCFMWMIAIWRARKSANAR